MLDQSIWLRTSTLSPGLMHVSKESPIGLARGAKFVHAKSQYPNLTTQICTDIPSEEILEKIQGPYPESHPNAVLKMR